MLFVGQSAWSAASVAGRPTAKRIIALPGHVRKRLMAHVETMRHPVAQAVCAVPLSPDVRQVQVIHATEPSVSASGTS